MEESYEVADIVVNRASGHYYSISDIIVTQKGPDTKVAIRLQHQSTGSWVDPMELYRDYQHYRRVAGRT